MASYCRRDLLSNRPADQHGLCCIAASPVPALSTQTSSVLFLPDPDAETWRNRQEHMKLKLRSRFSNLPREQSEEQHLFPLADLHLPGSTDLCLHVR